MDVVRRWYEELPEACPPGDAIAPDGAVYYRMCESYPASNNDFLSQRALSPDQVFKAPECIARAVSVFRGYEDCCRLLNLAVHENKVVLKLTLKADAGVVKKTGKSKTHYSWWRQSEFDPAPLAQAVEAQS